MVVSSRVDIIRYILVMIGFSSQCDAVGCFGTLANDDDDEKEITLKREGIKIVICHCA